MWRWRGAGRGDIRRSGFAGDRTGADTSCARWVRESGAMRAAVRRGTDAVELDAGDMRAAVAARRLNLRHVDGDALETACVVSRSARRRRRELCRAHGARARAGPRLTRHASSARYFFERREALRVHQLQQAELEMQARIGLAAQIVVGGEQNIEKARQDLLR